MKNENKECCEKCKTEVGNGILKYVTCVPANCPCHQEKSRQVNNNIDAPLVATSPFAPQEEKANLSQPSWQEVNAQPLPPFHVWAKENAAKRDVPDRASSLPQESKDWEDKIIALAMTYANAAYLVSEESHPRKEETDALEALMSGIRTQKQLSYEEGMVAAGKFMDESGLMGNRKEIFEAGRTEALRGEIEWLETALDDGRALGDLIKERLHWLQDKLGGEKMK
jgi:hypothetical protein